MLKPVSEEQHPNCNTCFFFIYMIVYTINYLYTCLIHLYFCIIESMSYLVRIYLPKWSWDKTNIKLLYRPWATLLQTKNKYLRTWPHCNLFSSFFFHKKMSFNVFLTGNQKTSNEKQRGKKTRKKNFQCDQVLNDWPCMYFLHSSLIWNK